MSEVVAVLMKDASGQTCRAAIPTGTPTGSATSVVQPYFVVRFWKRTA